MFFEYGGDLLDAVTVGIGFEDRDDGVVWLEVLECVEIVDEIIRKDGNLVEGLVWRGFFDEIFEKCFHKYYIY